MSSESHSVRRRNHPRCLLCRWVLVGLASYWVVWTELTEILAVDIKEFPFQSMPVSATLLDSREQPKEPIVQQKDNGHSDTDGEPDPPTDHEPKVHDDQSSQPRSRRAKSKRSKASTNQEEEFFDWSFLALCIMFTLMSIVRIRLEPSRRRRRIVAVPTARTTEANALQTLRRINRARQERGEPPISFDVYQALLNALLQDRTLLQGLAGHALPSPPRGATEHQLLLCQQLTITNNDDYDGDCSICLASYQPNDVVRILPCSHSFHKGCIDVWLQQSILCPMCKQALDDAEPPI